jgi:L-lactate utilization protein LutB
MIVDEYWEKKLENVKMNFEANNFNAYVAEDEYDAEKIVMEQIIPRTLPKSMSWGGSLTFQTSGLYEKLKDVEGIEVLDTYDKSFPPEEIIERRRQSLLTDLYITGTNAIIETGKLVNLDMMGNRVAAITFGPKNVVILAGRNKIVADMDSAIKRIKKYSAPINTRRLEKKTPCAKTSECSDCSSPERICNTWTVNEKSFPEGRINVILINRDLGF